MSQTSVKLREDRAKIILDAQALMDTAELGDGEADARFDNMMADADRLMAKIERMEKADREADKLNEVIGVNAEKAHISVGQAQNDVERYKSGFVAQLRRSARLPVTSQAASDLEFYNAASAGTTTAGGFTVATTLWSDIISAMIAEGGVRSVARVIETAGGGNIQIPCNDDTSNIAAIVAENSSVGTGTDLVFSAVTLGAYKYTSGVVLISIELLQDSAFSFDSFVMSALQHRFSRGTNLAYTVGNGTTAPQGVVTAATSGKVGATGQTLTLTYADMVDLEHSIALPYRRNAKWMASDGTFKSMKKLTDTLGRPIWTPSLMVNAPDSLLGYPLVLNADLAAPAANAKSLLFGDFQQFIIRDVMGLQLSVLHELYASTGQVGIVGLMRTDSRLATSSTAAIRFYQNSAT